MRRNLVFSTAAVLALAPALSACTVTLGDGTKISTSQETPTTPAAVATSASTTTPAEAATTDGTSEPPAQDTVPSEAPATQTPSEPAAPTTRGGDSSNPGSPNSLAGKKVTVPAGSGISDLEVIDIYGARSSSAYGRAVGVFRITNDRPVRLNLRLQLFDAAGKEIASNDGLNTVHTVGSHHLVTSNLVRLPSGETPSSFKITLLEASDMSGPTFNRVGQPRMTTKNGVPALSGSISYTGALKGTVNATGACIMPDGTIYSGEDNLHDQPSSGEYVIPLYDADKVDLSKATCYASV